MLPVSLYQRIRNVILAVSNHIEGGIIKALDVPSSYLIPLPKQ